MKIVFATNNEHKLTEIRAILGDAFEVVSLADIGCHEDIPETGQTLEENALMKAEYIYDKYHLSCFADDTGLEVEALDGAPGVYSARYAAMEATVPAGSPAGLWKALALTKKEKLTVTAKIPQRKFLGPSQELTQKVSQTVENEIKNILNS